MKNPPILCICGAERLGIQESRIYFKCGSRGAEVAGKVKLERSSECFERQRVGGKIQCPDKADAAGGN